MNITDHAIAYLKGSPSEELQSVVKLSPKDEPVVRPFLGDLHVCYVIDKGQTYEYIQYHHLEGDGIDADQLHLIGLQNLEKLICKKTSRVQPYGNIFAFLMGGDFEASIILLDNLWDDKFRQYVIGKYAVAVPARDVLAFCDVTSEVGIAELYELVNRVWPGKNHLVSNKIYVREEGGGWKIRGT